jgi:hypothetical protein
MMHGYEPDLHAWPLQGGVCTSKICECSTACLGPFLVAALLFIIFQGLGMPGKSQGHNRTFAFQKIALSVSCYKFVMTKAAAKHSCSFALIVCFIHA